MGGRGYGNDIEEWVRRVNRAYIVKWRGYTFIK